MEDDLDAQLKRTDPDRWLSSRFIADAGKRADVVALYAYDGELARAPRVASNPLLGEMRLTWWREALDEIYEGRGVRKHPVALALATAVERHGLDRAPLERMIDARYRELDATPLTSEDAMVLASGTAGAAAEVAFEILEGSSEYAAEPIGWSATWHLARSILAGHLHGSDLGIARAQVKISLAEARMPARFVVSSAGFPAVAHATLASLYAEGREPSLLGKQLRLTWAVARGRI